ncbi:MAG: acetyl-CoA C-acyltransferase [Bdellovibrionales bacterium]|nr:acetyl-CoA C-acyltransferase [Bdellovibrionales bacterium]
MPERNVQRVAVVSGVRTPFAKAGTALRKYSFQELGVHAVRALVERSGIEASAIDECVFGTVLLDPRTPNWAREIVFAANLPKSIYAHSVSNNCISGLVAVTDIAERIQLGLSHCGIAGGSESMSRPALLYSERGARAFLEFFRARSIGERARALSRLRPRDFLPAAPAVTEPSTGLTMGQHMEITAQELGISREAQGEVALASHRNAAVATDDGRLTAEIAPLDGIARDTLIRADTSIDKLKRLRPVFEKSDKGTLTAGNSSPLTDGASAVLLMSEQRANELGFEPLAFIRSYRYAAIDPRDGLLMAPAIAVPELLRAEGLTFDDFDLIEIHEAFGAQVVANIQAWEQGWKLPAVGSVDRSKVNVLGGSIAIGHPFAATGGRILTTLANEMKRRNARRGLISICAAGAMAGAMILER